MSTTRRSRVDEQLLLDVAIGPQLERRNVSRDIEVVTTGRSKEVLAAAGGEGDVAAVLVARGQTLGQQGVCDVGEDGLVGALVDDVHGQAVASFHQGVEVFAARVHLDPAGVVIGRGSLDAVDQGQLAGFGVLQVCPDLVGLEIGGVEVGFGGVEDHAVDAGVGLVLVVLDVLEESAIGASGEDVAVAGVFVEGVAVDVVGGLVGGEDEDGAGVSVGAGGEF